MAEHRVRVPVAGHGHHAANGERVLSGFMSEHPEAAPSVSQSVADGTLSVTFSLDARDANEAYELGRPIFETGIAASGLDPRPTVSLEVSLARTDGHGRVVQGQPALA